MSDETYLGDGLYASIEYDMVKLRAPRGHEDHEVYMEPEVLRRFAKFCHDNNIKLPAPPEQSE